MARSVSKTVRIGPLGTFVVGVLIFAAGYWLKGFVGDMENTGSQEAVMGNRVAIGLMILGGIFAVGNLLWFIFIVVIAVKKPPQG